ncbi:MAG: hypothetical protein GF383_01870 [Candidatus Lokiarchaeota archaeon]|nr:hypothetical protein [Candidatus Lokiarchaeota archaeon]MBD3338092.1 hypothetical protein [Candidatus Lokiarchaeota archaeon]
MIEDILSKVRTIFIGRKSELRRLRGLWDLACQDMEHLVYVFLNAPGVGKTTLLSHFGKLLESEQKGLFLKFVCSSEYDSPENINEDILFLIQKTLRTKRDLISSYIKLQKNSSEAGDLENLLDLLRKRLKRSMTKEKISLNDLLFALKRLSAIIPIFFAADEIQEFQKIKFNTVKGEKETALHYFTRLLKDLLNLNMLLVLSGTRYHILSQIGRKIGSPIREKVESLVLTNFDKEEIEKYVEKVSKLIKLANINREGRILSNYVENYHQFLLAFSGGHPRTVERVTMIFLSNLLVLLDSIDYGDYENFVDFLLPLCKQTFEKTLLTKEKEDELIKLSSHNLFSHVKKWIIERSYTGMSLGIIPELPHNLDKTSEIETIIYNLMNIGFIVQNGLLNYYITSYFHYLTFLRPFQEESENFLKEVLHNKYFELMCGFHSGFGYTFENVFTAAIFIYAKKIPKKEIVPLDISLLKGIKIIKQKTNWFQLPLKPNIIYHIPLAKAVDVMIVQNHELILIQITTARKPEISKITELISLLEELKPRDLQLENINQIRGWMVSLYEFSSETPKHERLVITTSDSLVPILGKDLYLRLHDVKQSF